MRQSRLNLAPVDKGQVRRGITEKFWFDSVLKFQAVVPFEVVATRLDRIGMSDAWASLEVARVDSSGT